MTMKKAILIGCAAACLSLGAGCKTNTQGLPQASAPELYPVPSDGLREEDSHPGEVTDKNGIIGDPEDSQPKVEESGSLLSEVVSGTVSTAERIGDGMSEAVEDTASFVESTASKVEDFGEKTADNTASLIQN